MIKYSSDVGKNGHYGEKREGKRRKLKEGRENINNRKSWQERERKETIFQNPSELEHLGSLTESCPYSGQLFHCINLEFRLSLVLNYIDIVEILLHEVFCCKVTQESGHAFIYFVWSFLGTGVSTNVI